MHSKAAFHTPFRQYMGAFNRLIVGCVDYDCGGLFQFKFKRVFVAGDARKKRQWYYMSEMYHFPS